MKKLLAVFIMVTVFYSCSNADRKLNIERAFYCWKNSVPDSDSFAHLKKLQVKKLYIKLFEIDYNVVQGNFPFSKNRPYRDYCGYMDSTKVVPTVFVKNDIFEHNDNKSLEKLADNIVFLIHKYSSEAQYDQKEEEIFTYDEIQIDCDWTKSTKDKYFYLLQQIKSISKKKISCTLRLYPYKYPDIMGVPPVDKVTLMCYNLINPLSQHDKNTILDIEELKKYLNEKKSYPLHLDVALPTYYWTQLYQNNQFVRLIDLSTNDVKKFARAYQPLWFQVEKDTSLGYRDYLRAGDQLKCEDISSNTLREAIAIIRNNVVLDRNTTITLFDLDRSTFNQYTHEEISSFYSDFAQ